MQILHTILETQGRPSLLPFPTPFIAAPVSLLFFPSTRTEAVSKAPTKASNETGIAALLKVRSPLLMEMGTTDIFQPVATGAPPRQIPPREDHPVPRLGIVREEPLTNFSVVYERVGPSKKSNIYK